MRKTQKNYYMKLQPFTLIDIESKTSKEFQTLNKLLDKAFKSNNIIHVFDLDNYGKVIVNKILNNGYKEVLTTDLENPVTSKLEDKTFVCLGSSIEGKIISIRLKTDEGKQVLFKNVKSMFGNKSTVEKICNTVSESEELIGMSKAIENLLQQGHTALTVAGNSFKDFKYSQFDGKRTYINEKGKETKRDFTQQNFEKIFPPLDNEIHEYIMKSFQGGLCYFKDEYKGKTIELKEAGIQYDINSMYPSIMIEENIPYGVPTYFKGQYKPVKAFKFATNITALKNKKNNELYFQRVFIKKLLLKEAGIPCIKDRRFDNISVYDKTVEIERYYKEAENIELVLNSIDIELLFDNYYIEDIEYIDGYSFNFRKGNKFFEKFISKWIKEKEEAIKNNDNFMYLYSKLMLNSCFGKFATKNDKTPSLFQFSEYDNKYIRQRLIFTDKKDGKSVYSPVGAYITSYGRKKLIKAIKDNYNNFIYSDTDSIYLTAPATGINIDSVKLGYWKNEFNFNKMYIIGKKQYIVQKTDNTVKVALAGFPDEAVKSQITSFNEFYEGKRITASFKKYDLETGLRLEDEVRELTIKNLNI